MWKKILGYTILSIVILAGIVLAWLVLRKPETAAPLAIQVQATPQRLARGEYLYKLADCDGCHSEHDLTRFALPVTVQGRGGPFPEPGLPGKVYVPNISSDRETGLGAWTDGEILRAVREGIGRDGRALFPLMPYEEFRSLSDEDAQSLVAYLRTIPPVRNAVPRTKLNFPVNLLIKSAPRPVTEPVQTPGRNNKRLYGEYLTTVGLCVICHTPVGDRGRLDMTRRFSGGREFNFPGAGTVISANITPDAATGIGNWSLDRFQQRFYQHKDKVRNGSPKVGPEFFTLMPWLNLATVPPEDLEAIYVYLTSQRPVENKVTHHPELPPNASAKL